MLCGVRGLWGAAGAAGVCALALVGRGERVCAWCWAWSDVPQALSLSPLLMESLLQAFGDIQVVLGCEEVVGADSLGMERIGQHGFPCGTVASRTRRLEAAVLCRPPAGPVDQTPEGRLRPSPLLQLQELRLGPALPPLSTGRSVALGGGVGVGVCGWVTRTSGSGGPGGLLVVLCCGGARGAGAWAYADPCVRERGLRFRYGLGSAGAAVGGNLLDVGRHRGLVGGRGHC